MTQITIKIEGMMCPKCEARVREKLQNTISPKKLTVDHGKGEAVIVSETDLDEEMLRSAVEEIGYSVLEIEKKPFEKKGFFSSLLGK